MRCKNLFDKFFEFLKLREKHTYLITNVFCTLYDINKFDVIEKCQECGCSKSLVVDKETLLEIVNLYPNAFDPTVRNYILSWMK